MHVDLSEHGARLGIDGVDDAVFEAVESEVVPADWAQVTYTSGSSALPKGVVHTHGAIVRTTAAPVQLMAGGPMPAQTGEDASWQRSFAGFPFFWIGGTLSLARSMHQGSALVCIPRFEPGAALDLAEREGVTSIGGWPSTTQAIRAHPSFPHRKLNLSQDLQNANVMPTGPIPGYPAHRSMSELVGNWAGAARRAVNRETGEVLPDLEEGELVVRGYALMQGYYKKEREETFDEDGWLHTGDRVYIHENRPYFVGRYYEMVKTKGANVSPREVEVVIESWPEIEHVVVFGTPHPVLEEEVTAVIVFMPGASMTPDQIRERAAKALSSYKVPSRIEIREGDTAIPWLGSGKPDKLRLRDELVAQRGS
jgi:acyl-CoA synthetase (AMP-forming)/AMP-acid ligase II